MPRRSLKARRIGGAGGLERERKRGRNWIRAAKRYFRNLRQDGRDDFWQVSRR
jgi:hypothetical protein